VVFEIACGVNVHLRNAKAYRLPEGCFSQATFWQRLSDVLALMKGGESKVSASNQEDPKRQVHPGAASERSIRISKDVIQVEGDRVVVNDPALAKILQERQECSSSGEEGISIIIGRPST
jgi:hypothetical protein